MLRALGLLAFLGVLATVDLSLRHWGSSAIQARPRPGGRVTALFLSVCLTCGALELAAQRLAGPAPAAAVLFLLLQFPLAVAVALTADRLMSRS